MTDRKIVDYVIAADYSEVNKLLIEGYQPYGYPTHDIRIEEYVFAQAMVKYETEGERMQRENGMHQRSEEPYPGIRDVKCNTTT